MAKHNPPAVTEKKIQAAVIDHWRHFGLPSTLVAAIPNARAFGQAGLTKGLFDLLVITPGQVRFMELKTEKGRMSPAQDQFREMLIKSQIEYAVTYGRNDPIVVLEMWGVVRKAK